MKRFTWLEWVFVAVATVSIFGILAASIERLVYFEEHFVNISVKENGSWAAVMCNEWTCTNDFIFTVVLLLNMSKNESFAPPPPPAKPACLICHNYVLFHFQCFVCSTVTTVCFESVSLR